MPWVEFSAEDLMQQEELQAHSSCLLLRLTHGQAQALKLHQGALNLRAESAAQALPEVHLRLRQPGVY